MQKARNEKYQEKQAKQRFFSNSWIFAIVEQFLGSIFICLNTEYIQISPESI